MKVNNLIVWDKISGPGSNYSYAHEFIMYHTSSRFVIGGSNVWREKSFSSGAKVTDGEKIHPTQKVKEIVRKIVTNHSNKGDLVIDPFSGSGTSALVCLEEDREFIGFELSEQYFNASINRLKEQGAKIALY